MASADSTTNGNNSGLTAAQKLMQKHDEAHKATIEEVPDEEDLTPHPHPQSSTSILESTEDNASAPGWAAPMSTKAAGKRREEPSLGKENKPLLNTQSDELFPSLGGAPKPAQTKSSAPIWGAKKSTPTVPAPTNGSRNGVSTNGTSTPQSGVNTPPPSAGPTVPRTGSHSLAGQVLGTSYTFDPKELPRSATKKPLPDILRDINKKYRSNLTQTTGEGGVIKISALGTQTSEQVKRQAFKDLGSQITTKSSKRVSIPRSARAHIIGKQGSTIKSLQEMSGARIQMPKMEDTPEPVDDDDDSIYVIIEGNPIAIRIAQEEVAKIAGERSSSVKTKLRTIPAEFYPFIAGPHNSRASALEAAHGVQIQVPTYHTWISQPPPQAPLRGSAPVFAPAAGDNHITLDGDRAAVQAARAEIERITQELRQQLTLEQFSSIERLRHRFIIGERGIPAQDFFAETGCGIILPGNADDESITIVGPSDQIQAAMDRAIDLAMGMHNSSLDISKQVRNSSDIHGHARNITQYLRDRKEIENLEQLHQAHIVTSFDPNGRAAPWELYSRDGKNTIKAKSEISRIVEAHPPTRMATIPVDEFFYKYIREDVTPQVKKEYGVHVVVPKTSESGAPVLLVFEGESSLKPEYQIPRGQPSAADVQAFQRGLEDARKHILEIISAQAQITSQSIDVPRIFHEKLRRFIQKEQQARDPTQIPVRVIPSGTVITMRGPAPAVESLAAKVNAFVTQAIEDEKERGFTLSFDFPQKHVSQLVGRAGSHIIELRDKFDVEINPVDDGKIEVKGPKAKAEAAKAHITSLGRQWADETTYILKVDPKFHSELIGAHGAQINKLQTKYKVQIHFPRSAKPASDDQSNADAASETGRRGSRREHAPDEVVIKGPKKGADEARDEILSLVQYFKDISYTATVSIQAGQLGSLIGNRGATIEEIRQVTGAKVEAPKGRDSKDPSTRVEILIKGTKSQVAQAKKLIEEKKDIFDQTVTKTLEVDKKHHGSLIGPQGSTIREIVINAGGSENHREIVRMVQFPKAEADGNHIKIEGKEDVVDKIIAAMEQMVSERQNQATETIDVPTDKHRSLIGRGGEIKKDLESKLKVSLDIPRQNSNQTGIKITGLLEDIEKAKLHILDLVKEQEGETVQVPRKVHHSVADKGQFFRKLRNEHKVTVDHAGSKLPPMPSVPSNVRENGSSMPLITDDAADSADAHSWKTIDKSESDIDGEIPWILRGSPQNVEKAKTLLATAIQQALQNSTIGYLTLPDPHTYRYVVGQGGSKVNSIRKSTGCKITVPKDQAKDEAIEIIGSAEGVEKARELILKAVNEGGNAANGSRS